MKKTKMVCTIGPASEQKDQLEALINAGMNVMRMNFSHGDHVEQGFRIKNVKALNAEKGWNIGIMLDTKGPEIRTGYLKNDEPVMLTEGNTIRITMDYSYLGDANKVAISYPGLYDDISVGGRILIEDGNLTLTVTEKDDIEFGCDEDVDFISASFIRRPQDIKDIRDILAAKKNDHIKIISKIENQEGVSNMEEIIALSDGVMVARGDLGVDVDAWDLPAIQKEMIYLAQASGKIVVTATQMLDSMQQNPRPTRAEVSDVHNAVLDGTSATMLSGESAQGDYPLEAVTYMAKIDERAEDDIDHELMIDNVLSYPNEKNEIDAIGLAVAQVANNFEVAAVVAEGDQELAFKISQYRPAADVFFATKERSDCRSLQLAWGVQPVCGKLEDAYKAAVASLNLEKGDSILEVTRDGVKFTQVK